ncbi:MFS transporter [Chloroflexota bacterium]
MTAGTLQGLTMGLSMTGISAFFKPIAEELNLTRAVASLAGGLSRLGGSFEAPLSGFLVDKFGPRWIMLIGINIFVIGLILMSRINSTLAYIIAWIIVSTGVNFAATVAVDKTLTNWFVKKRGLVMGLKSGLIGVFGAAMLPIVAWLIVSVGWRSSFLIWGGIVPAILLPLVWFFVKQQRPEYYGLLPDGAKAESDSTADTEDMIEKGTQYAADFQETEFTLRQAMKTLAFWLLLVAMVGQGVATGGFGLHCIPFLTDQGISPTMAGALMGMMIFFTIPARTLAGLIADRLKKTQLQLLWAAGCLLRALGIGFFLFSQTTVMIYVFLILYGIGTGVVAPLDIIVRGRYFGRKAYGSIAGSSSMFTAPFGVAAPIFTGWVYDTTGNYITALIVFALLFVLTAILLFFIRSPKPPANITGIDKFM